MNKKDNKILRRFFFEIIGKVSVLAAFFAEGVGAIRAFVPQVLYEPPSKFKIGKPEDFSEGITYLPEYKLYVFRNGGTFSTISAVCTHLTCVVDWKPDQKGFYCSCHGSKFSEDGTNLTGPAPRPLPWYALSLAPDHTLLVETDKHVTQSYKFSLGAGK
jgi:cytochrome b6-f complex iron-sulfur subunit